MTAITAKNAEKKTARKAAGKTSSTVGQVLIYAFLVLLALVYLLPLVWMVFVSLKTDVEIFKAPFAMPERLNWENYTFAWTAGNLGTATMNSVIVCGTSLILTMALGSMASFAIAKLKWKLANLTMTYFLMGMMIPIHCILIPLFTTFSDLGLYNKRMGLILPYVAMGLPTTIFIMTGFFQSLPNELMEASCIDGCSVYRHFLTIALPLARTGLFVSALMVFVGNWNELLLAMVFIYDESAKTLPVALSKFVGPYNTNYTQMFAAIIVAVTPTIVAYCLFSNQIVDGLTAGSVKG